MEFWCCVTLSLACVPGSERQRFRLKMTRAALACQTCEPAPGIVAGASHSRSVKVFDARSSSGRSCERLPSAPV